MRGRRTAVCANRGGDCPGGLRVTIDDGDAGPLSREEARDGRADARARPGHDGGLPLEIEHYRPQEDFILYR